jgi:hypothetical protein
MAGYSGVDFIDFDSQLNDEEKLVRQTARQFVENEVVPIIEIFPANWSRSSANSDFLAQASTATAVPACPTWRTVSSHKN